MLESLELLESGPPVAVRQHNWWDGSTTTLKIGVCTVRRTQWRAESSENDAPRNTNCQRAVRNSTCAER